MKRILFLWIVGLWMASHARAQFYTTHLQKFAAQLPEEVYLQFDQEYYVPGETAFFKAYLLRDGKPVSYQTNLYLQLLNAASEVIVQQVWPVNGSAAMGSISFPDSLPNAIYYIRALTSRMAEEHRGGTIRSLQVSRSSKEVNPAALTVGFFPESNVLVEGIANRVVVHAQRAGRPESVLASVRDDKGTLIRQLTTDSTGFAEFVFRPGVGASYYAEVAGFQGRIALPTVLSRGVQLNVEEDREGKIFTLFRQGNVGTVDVVVQLNHQVVFEQEVDFEDYPSVRGHLITKDLGSGILQFAVFDKERRLLCERLSFVDNGNYLLPVDIHPQLLNGSVRTQSTGIIHVHLENDAIGTISASQQPERKDDHIVSWFLLSGKLKKPVYHPRRYFDSRRDTSGLQIDRLLITQSLRENPWRTIDSAEGNDATTLSTDFIRLAGRVWDERRQVTLGPGKLNVYVHGGDSTSASYETTVDEQGRFELDSMRFGGRSKLYYAYLHKFEKQREINLEVLPSHPHDEALAQPLQADVLVHRQFATGNSEELVQRVEQLKFHDEAIKVLERVTVRAKRTRRPTEELEQRYARGVFLLPAKVTLDNVNDPSRDGSMTVVDYIRNRINEVELTGRGFVNRKTLSMETQTRWLVGLFLDESLAELPMLRSIRMEEVAMVKFFDMGWVGVGSTYPGGALAIYTKKHEEMAPPPPKLPSIDVWGYTLAKPFLEIDYGQKDVKHATNDKRATLYWNPGVYLTKKIPAFEWDFYTNDVNRRVRLQVEGVDREGRFFFEEVGL